MDFTKELKDRVTHIEKVIENYMPKDATLQKTVTDAMNYTCLLYTSPSPRDRG